MSKNRVDNRSLKSSFVEEGKDRKPVALVDEMTVFGVTVILLLSVLPFLIYYTVRITYSMPIDPNEGWNVYHTSRVMSGEPLYRDLSDVPITPVNYPPLSFVITGLLSHLTGSLLLTGRAVSLASLLIVGYLIFQTVESLTRERAAALFAALLWLGFMVKTSGHYVGMYDPQLLGQVFSTLAFCLYYKWGALLTRKAIYTLAFFCCFALFIKHSLIAVPLSLAAALFFKDRKAFWNFAAAGLVIASAMLLGGWLYAGNDLFSNFLDLYRPVSNAKATKEITSLFFSQFLAVVFLPFGAVVLKRRKEWTPILVYFCLSLLLGAYAIRGAGTGESLWFDFFIAGALVFGVFAAEGQAMVRWRPGVTAVAAGVILLGLVMNEFFIALYLSPDGMLEESTATIVRVGQVVIVLCGIALLIGRQWIAANGNLAFCGIIACSLGLFLVGGKFTLREALRYDKLRLQEEAYRQEVALLRNIGGHALFGDLLLGFDSGKEVLIEVSNASKLMFSGRIPESILTDRIRQKYFDVIVTTFDVRKLLTGPAKTQRGSATPGTTATLEWSKWPHNALKVLRDHYEILDRKGRAGRHVFYLPRGRRIAR